MPTTTPTRRALVTGATGGIGAAIARALAADGVKVAIGFHTDADAAKALAIELGGDGGDGGDAIAVRYALDDPQPTFDELERTWGGIDILVTSAVRWAGRRPAGVRFEDVAPGTWVPVVSDNLAATLRTVQLALPGMRATGWGRIVLISSHVAHDGRPGQEFYGAAKSGLHGFARSLSWDCGGDGVLVNVLSPGLTTTERVLTLMPDAIRLDEQGRTPTGRLSTPEDVADVAAFLASPRNANMTGELLTVAGGR